MKGEVAAKAPINSNYCLAAFGDACDPATWSGIPFHLLQSAEDVGFNIVGMRFDLAQARRGRFVWAVGRVAQMRRPRGFQYAPAFLARLWSTAPLPAPGSLLLNCAQLFPSGLFDNSAFHKAFFLDQTLLQLFEYYGHGAYVAPDIREAAIAEERRQYQSADVLIMQSRWAADSVIRDYGVDPARVKIVLPGANLDRHVLDGWEARQAGAPPDRPRDAPVQLIFVGKDWHRKGLDRLIRAFDIVRRRGRAVELHVIGANREALPSSLHACDGIRWHGFVDKRNDASRFIEKVARADIGCLLSRREAGGISLLEFARLGMPTIAPATGGAIELAVPGATTLVDPGESDTDIADQLDRLVSNKGLLRVQREAAWRARSSADWRRAVREIRQALDTHSGSDRRGGAAPEARRS